MSVVRISKSDGSPKYFNVEVLLSDYKDHLTRWNNNYGYVSKTNYSATLKVLSHWSYTVTESFLMVVDLQTLDRDDKYIPTDHQFIARNQDLVKQTLEIMLWNSFLNHADVGVFIRLLNSRKIRYIKAL